jgi:hypothetical protein
LVKMLIIGLKSTEQKVRPTRALCSPACMPPGGIYSHMRLRSIYIYFKIYSKHEDNFKN